MLVVGDGRYAMRGGIYVWLREKLVISSGRPLARAGRHGRLIESEEVVMV